MNSLADPPLKKIAAALRKTTETLACELSASTSVAPAWTDFEWSIAQAAAAMQGVSSLLLGALRWEGPPVWQQFLQEQSAHALARYRFTSELIENIDWKLQQAGMAAIALKGAALYSGGLYEAGRRPMGDIDLLVREQDLRSMTRILEACNYEPSYTSRRHETFQPRLRNSSKEPRLGEHADNPIRVEVHTKIAESLPVTAIDISDFLVPGIWRPGLNPYRSNAALMMHLLLHAAGNMRARALRLIQLHDIALLTGRLSLDDWEEMLAADLGGRGVWWAFAPLSLVARYYPNNLKPHVLEQLRTGCTRWLRLLSNRQMLSDVSWSNIRIEAFPGLEWSQTSREALKFMISRILPDRQARLELKDAAAQVPGETTIPWYGISHSARILQWVFSRPPRVQTLLSVRAALLRR